MYRLQIYLKSNDGESPILKFLHITDGDITVKQLLYDAAARFKSVYPGHGRLMVVRVQDSTGCDLDPGFFVNQVCSETDELHFYTDRKFSNVFKRVLNPLESPAKKRKSLQPATDSPKKTAKRVLKRVNSPLLEHSEPEIQETPTPAARHANFSSGSSNSSTSSSFGSQGSQGANGALKKGKSASKPTQPRAPASKPEKIAKAATSIRPNLVDDSQSSSLESVKMPPPPVVIQETPDRKSSEPQPSGARVDTPFVSRTRSQTSSQTSIQSTEQPDAANNEASASEEDTTASESSEDEVSVPVKAVEMPKTSVTLKEKAAPRRPDLKVSAKVTKSASPTPPQEPSGPAEPSPRPARKSLSNLSKLESLRNVDVHDGVKKSAVVKKQDQSDSEGLSTDKSSDSSDSSDDDSSNSDDNSAPAKTPRRSTLLSSMIGKK